MDHVLAVTFGSPDSIGRHYGDIFASEDWQLDELWEAEAHKLAEVEANANHQFAKLGNCPLGKHEEMSRYRARYFQVLAWRYEAMFMPQNRQRIILREARRRGLERGGNGFRN